MKNLNQSEKSKGVVLFATNTETVDYLSIAGRCERLVNHYLDLPVTIVTNPSPIKNQRYSVDSGTFEQWNNSGRANAYEASPYDQTILIDCDYLVFDDNLLKILATTQDYTIAGSNKFIDAATPTKMGLYSLPALWATVIVFNKTPKAKMLFDLVARIERNYPYYQRLYNLESNSFRNDYAFTIADNIINGYAQDAANHLPWPIYTVANPIDSLELQDQKLLLKTQGKGYVLPKQSLHIISKSYLLSDACDQLIKVATDA
jgi:hypothetical protein